MALPKTKGEAIRLALFFGAVCSVASAVQYAPTGWRRGGFPHIHLVAAIALNLGAAAAIGSFYGGLIGSVHSRTRAALNGAIICGPLAMLIQLTIIVYPLTPGRVGVVLLMGVCLGIIYGVGMWSPDTNRA